MLVEDGGRHSVCLGVYHPNLPCSVVFKRGAKDVSLSKVCGKVIYAVGLVVHYIIHADRYKWFGVVVMLTIDVGVGGDFRVGI